MESEEVRFIRPLSKDKVLFLCGIPNIPWDIIWSQLKETFSYFGPLYSVYVPDNNNISYAIIQFYSKTSTQAALLSTKNNLFIGKNKVQVNVSSVCLPSIELPLHLSKSYELANYYFSFNGWNIKLLDLRLQQSYYCCTVELNLRQHSVKVCGTGQASVSLDQSRSNDESENKIHGNGQAIKAAYNRASERAFAQIVIILERNETIKVQVHKQSL